MKKSELRQIIREEIQNIVEAEGPHKPGSTWLVKKDNRASAWAAKNQAGVVRYFKINVYGNNGMERDNALKWAKTNTKPAGFVDKHRTGPYAFEGYEDEYEPEEWDSMTRRFADPGGKSALHAASKSNPRNLPCPQCHRPNSLTPADRAKGYVCDRCADAAERGEDY